MDHTFDGYYETDLDTDPREEALADYWIHRDETLAERAAAELAAELLATEEFIAWLAERREEALEHQIAAYDAAQVAA